MSARDFKFRGNSRGRVKVPHYHRQQIGQQRPLKHSLPAEDEEGFAHSSKRPKTNQEGPAVVAFPKVLLTGTPRLPVFPVLVSNIGLDLLCDVFYQELIAADPRSENILPVWELRYAAHMCYIYRCLTVNRTAGVYTDHNISVLKLFVEKVKLPAVIANYIESIGVVELSTGAKVLPRFGDNLTVFGIQGAVNAQRLADGEIQWSTIYRDPRSILLQEGRAIINQPWSVDGAALTSYIEHSSRITFKRSVMMREVNWDNIEGKPSMLVTTREGVLATGLSPQMLLESDFKLGTCYRFRIEGGQIPPGCEDAQLLPYVFEGTPCSRRHELALLSVQQE